MARSVAAKKSGFGVEMRTFKGTKGMHIVFKLPSGAFHTFLEVEAKGAAVDIDSKLSRDENTRALRKRLWARQPTVNG